MMTVTLKATPRTAAQTRIEIVEDFADASRKVREYIERNGLGSGCSDDPYFAGGDVRRAGNLVAKVSYNGRVWNTDGKEIEL